MAMWNRKDPPPPPAPPPRESKSSHQVDSVLEQRIALLPQQTQDLLQVAAVLGLIALAAVLVYGCYRRWPPVVGLMWYVIWMLPAAGLVPLRYFRAERYLYPASWGLLLAVMMCFLLPGSYDDSRR